MSIYDIFIMMFYALDAEYDDAPSEELRLFLSDMNPFIFKDEGSAEPSVYENFKKAYQEYGKTAVDEYSFVSLFIDTECTPAIKKAFSGISHDEWDEALKEYTRAA